MKFVKIYSKRTYVFVQDKKIPTWDLTTLFKIEVVKYSELSTLWLSNSIAIFGVFVGDQDLIKFGSRWINHLIETNKLFNDFLYPQGWLEDEPVLTNELR